MNRSKKSKVGEIPASVPVVDTACSANQAKVEHPVASIVAPATVGCTCETSAVGNLVTSDEPKPVPPKPKRKKRQPVKKEDNSMAVLAGLGAIALVGAALLRRA